MAVVVSEIFQGYSECLKWHGLSKFKNEEESVDYKCTKYFETWYLRDKGGMSK